MVDVWSTHFIIHTQRERNKDDRNKNSVRLCTDGATSSTDSTTHEVATRELHSLLIKPSTYDLLLKYPLIPSSEHPTCLSSAGCLFVIVNLHTPFYSNDDVNSPNGT